MIDPRTIQAKLPPYKGERSLIKRRQYTHDIIGEILDTHRDTARHYDKIAINHWTGDPLTTARGIYDYMVRNFPYQEEKTYVQTVKEPAAILAERLTFGSDCKHYASYIVGVGEALKRRGFPIRCIYRFASYDPQSRAPGHVFAVWVIGNREYWIDPVPQIGGFDNRQIRPAFIQDKKPPRMERESDSIGSLYRISGVGAAGSMPARTTALQRANDYHWSDYYYQPVQDMVGKASPKKQAAKAANKVKPKKKLFSKIALAPARDSFLLLVKANVFHLATKMWQKAASNLSSANWKILSDKWRAKGGNPAALLRNIKQGVRMWNKLHPKKRIAISGYTDTYGSMSIGASGDLIDIPGMAGIDALGEYDGPSMNGTYYEEMGPRQIIGYVHAYHAEDMANMGVVAAPVAAGIIAAASPILLALANVLKGFGVDTSKADATAGEDLNDLAQNHNEAADKDEKINADGTVTHPDGTKTAVTDNADGSQTLNLTKQPGTAGEETAASGGGGGSTTDVAAPGKEGKEPSGFSKMMSNVGDFIKEHKTPFIVGGAILGSIIVFKMVSGGKITIKRGRR